MFLSAGTVLGPYQILSPLGKGGMGEVYRAKDTNLDREIAIKSCPIHSLDDPERPARFQREAKALASLNHPSIATIYGLEESPEGKAIDDGVGGWRYAQTAAASKRRSTGCDSNRRALEAAHEKGITHRDLKPANIRSRTQGSSRCLTSDLLQSGHGVRIGRGLAHRQHRDDRSGRDPGHRRLHVSGAGRAKY